MSENDDKHKLAKTTVVDLYVPPHRISRMPKPLPPVSIWSVRISKLANAGKRTVDSLRSSYAVKEVTEMAVKHCVTKLLDPKGAFILALSKNKKIGPIVKAVVASNRYQVLTERIAESSAGLVGKGFTVKPTLTLPPEDIREISADTGQPKQDALPPPVSHPASWTSTMSVTSTNLSVRFKGRPVNNKLSS